MINRIYLKEFLSFKEVDLELDKGLIVFTGPSGAGKSVLMQSILSLFAITECKASLGEVTLSNLDIQEDSYGIDKGDEITIKEIKKDKVRYFLNSQTISKKNLNAFSKSLIKHLHLKDISDFESSKLIGFLDSLCSKEKKEFNEIKTSFDENIQKLFNMEKELQKIKEDETKLEDLKEFAKFEVEKIASVNPQVGEYEELSEIKKDCQKKRKSKK
ncbi:AAA family ATPase [Halarcobacter anaerophilus]|uniref:AAA family ATPase n=1 Tax=Halarcobacter anaerophilus TaxID=877500 RepID=UPI000AC5B402|nr:AAA family ATPase [Halarcobacter anaerophilus]